MGKDPFKKQLKNYIKEGNFEYIFNKQKLIRDKVADPDAFVRGKFQKVFRENAEELFEQNPSFFKQFKRSNNENVGNFKYFEELINDDAFLNQLSNFIKIE